MYTKNIHMSELSITPPQLDFAYPTLVDIAKFAPLHRHDQMPDPTLAHLTALSAGRSLLAYSRSDIGAYHGEQTARYPTLHKDLPEEFAGTDDPEEVHQFRRKNLKLLTPDNSREAHRTGDQALDLNPLGHQALVAIGVNRLLNGALSEAASTKDPAAIEALRHAAALHDLGESEHPDIAKLCGRVVGDISSAVGKTDDDRAQEGKILRAVLGQTLGDAYDPKFSELIAAMSNHELDGEDADLVWAHAVLEGAHAINTIETGIYFAERARRLAQRDDPAKRHAETLIDVANDTYWRSSTDHKLRLVREQCDLDPVSEKARDKLDELRYRYADAAKGS